MLCRLSHWTLYLQRNDFFLLLMLWELQPQPPSILLYCVGDWNLINISKTSQIKPKLSELRDTTRGKRASMFLYNLDELTLKEFSSMFSVKPLVICIHAGLEPIRCCRELVFYSRLKMFHVLCCYLHLQASNTVCVHVCVYVIAFLGWRRWQGEIFSDCSSEVQQCVWM